MTGRNSQVNYTDGGLLLTFTMTGSNTYSLRTVGGVFTGTLANGSPITRLSVYNTNSGGGMERNFYVGEMAFSNQPTTNVTVAVVTPTVTVSSATSIPDSWWDSFNINVGDRNPDADLDSDGFSNAQEHALGTDPTNNASAFRITSIVPGANSTAVTWSSVAGKNYRLQGSTNLGTLSWSNIGSAVQATNHSTSTNHATSVGQHFYRVILAQ